MDYIIKKTLKNVCEWLMQPHLVVLNVLERQKELFQVKNHYEGIKY